MQPASMPERPARLPTMMGQDEEGAVVDYSPSSPRAGGGYDVELASGRSVPDNLHCTLCKRVLRLPWQSSCGHRFCASCFTKTFSHVTNPSCPLDQVPLIKSECFHDVFAEREVMSLPEHLQACQHTPCRCPNGCQANVIRRHLADHLQQACEYRPVRCEHCNEQVAFNLMTVHRETCNSLPVPCPNGCTSRLMPRSQVDEHRSVCPRQVVKCFYHPMGCEFEGQRSSLVHHHEVSMPYHLQVCFQQAQQNQLRIAEERELNRAMAARVATLEENFARLLSSVESKPSLSYASATLPPEIESLREMTLSQEKRLESAERSIGLHDVQLSDVNIRQDLQELRTTNGVLVWKISDFRRRQQDAISGKTPSLYSPPFFTSPAGYKVCARVYLDGDGVGRGTHLSLFFVLMKGEFDALLPFPFLQKVSLILLDQRTVNPRHVVETFRPDPSSSSFQRPQQEMNVASGCPLFMPLATLNHSTYLHEDTVYFKIVVHQQGLQAPDQP